MVTVLRRLKGAAILEDYPSLCAYVDRGKARPAYKRAFATQLAVLGRKPDRRSSLIPLSTEPGQSHPLEEGSAVRDQRWLSVAMNVPKKKNFRQANTSAVSRVRKLAGFTC